MTALKTNMMQVRTQRERAVTPWAWDNVEDIADNKTNLDTGRVVVDDIEDVDKTKENSDEESHPSSNHLYSVYYRLCK